MKKSQAERFQAAKHQKEIAGSVWNANYDGTIMERVLTAVHAALWKASSAKQTESSSVGPWRWVFPYLGGLWFQGLGQVGSPKAALQQGRHQSPSAMLNKLASWLGHTQVPHFSQVSLLMSPPHCAHCTWLKPLLLLPASIFHLQARLQPSLQFSPP